jgi:hypothetical protein
LNTEPKSVLSIKENDITFSHPMHVYHQEILDIVKNHYPDGFDQNMVAI